MNRNETAQETLQFDSEPQGQSNSGAVIGLLIAALSGALVGSCLTLIFLLPYVAR